MGTPDSRAETTRPTARFATRTAVAISLESEVKRARSAEGYSRGEIPSSSSSGAPMRILMLLAALVLPACRTTDKVTDTGDLTGAVDLDADGDGYPASEDCDDADAAVNPGATEVCDGVDNNCVDGVDEGVTSSWYVDADGDGFGDAAAVTEACDQPPGAVPTGTDCDDTDASVYPSATEICDGVDNNCDGQADEGLASTWYPDADGDGFGDTDAGEALCEPPDGWVQVGNDCDDADGSVFPGAAEVCNGEDEDCDGEIDEGVTTTY